MSFYSIYRIVKDITRTIFGHRFWRKLLIVCLIAFGIWFFMHSKGYCVEETEDVNYRMVSYYDSLINDAIIRIWNSQPADLLGELKDTNNNYVYYFCYGTNDGSSYLGSNPINKQNINIVRYLLNTNSSRTPTSYDYLGLTGKTIYKFDATFRSRTMGSASAGVTSNVVVNSVYMPIDLYNYVSNNWVNFVEYLRYDNTQAIEQLLEDIKQDTTNIVDALTDESYDDNDVVIGSTAIDNVTASTDGMFTTIFTNFNNAVSGGVSELVIPLPHTEETITIPSDIVSSHLGNFAYLVQAFWMYVFGLYTWRFVNNLIHRIKDGSILDGFKSDGEVITNTML